MPEPAQPANNEGNNAAPGPNNAASGPNDAASTLVAPEGSQRRSSRSPSRPLGLDQAPFPRTLPTENIGKPPSRKPSPSPSVTALATSNNSSAPPLPVSTAGRTTLPKASSSEPPAKQVRENSPRPPPMSPVAQPVNLPPSSQDIHGSTPPLPTRPAPVRRKQISSITSTPETDPQLPTKGSARSTDPNLLAPPSPFTGGHKKTGETSIDANEQEPQGDGNSVNEGEGNIGDEATFRQPSGDSSQSDDNQTETEEEGDDYRPKKKLPEAQPKKKRQISQPKKKAFKNGEVVTLDHSEQGSEEESAMESDAPIFQEPDVGPTLAKKQAKASAATAKSQASRQARSATLKSSKTIHSAKPPTASSSSRGGKRKAINENQSPGQRKRSRVQQISGLIPETPESEVSASQNSASEARPGPAAASQSQTEPPTDFDTPTSRARRGKDETIWDYYYDRTVKGSKNKACQCRACGKIVKGRSTSNFHDHQRTKCPKLAEAARLGIPGIMCDIPITASQTTIGTTTGAIIQPYNHKKFLAATMKWIIVSGLPFTTIQNPHLQKAFEAANPAARLQSARTLARKLEDTYDIVLLRLLHSRGKHTGVRMGNGMFELFHNTCGIATRLGPGTADNASNNRTAADRLAQLLSTELLEVHVGADLIGCLCHIANIAALKYLEGASQLTPIDFAYARENIPEIRVMGETPCWNADLEERPTEEDLALLARQSQEREEVDTHDSNVQRMDEAEDDEIVGEEDLEEPDEDSTPLDMVHQLAVFVHSSPQRMEEFEKARGKLNPATPKGMLPLKDVVTRWNSKEAAIARVLKLRSKCPRFTKSTFDTLKLIQPTLKIFLNLTEVYSEVAASSYRIIPDLIHAIDQLEEIHKHPSAAHDRRRCVVEAVARLQKYLNKFVQNPWVCAAFALDPTVREEGLSQLLTVEYDGSKCFENTLTFIRLRTEEYQEAMKGSSRRREEEVQWVKKHARVNKFASSRYKAGHQDITHDVDDPWECYNSEMKRFETLENESVLGYWKRMAEHKEMRPLAMVAKDILGLASSSASVERLFSQAGFVLGNKRGSLSAKFLSKQVMLRMWEGQGIMTADDM
ncbi:hypothetical protein QFC21_005829 [Naganishia friedmannii]|uniref:Uncharacterized protein n=1 Tax=Naganishia friedmannii TaxID=89922 RepID=A0ACC2V8R1_9TREE|nr:hypothetical protein QFC21_005829 [Naganishia friedmannii]